MKILGIYSRHRGTLRRMDLSRHRRGGKRWADGRVGGGWWGCARQPIALQRSADFRGQCATRQVLPVKRPFCLAPSRMQLRIEAAIRAGASGGWWPVCKTERACRAEAAEGGSTPCMPCGYHHQYLKKVFGRARENCWEKIDRHVQMLRSIYMPEFLLFIVRINDTRGQVLSRWVL